MSTKKKTEPTPGTGTVCSPQFVAVYREWDRSQWPLGLRRGSTSTRWRRLRVRMPPEAWMSAVLLGCYTAYSELDSWHFNVTNTLSETSVNPSAWGHLNPSSYYDVGRLFLRGT